VLTDIRVETLKSYGIDAALAPRFPDPAAPEAAIRDQAANSAARWDANSQDHLAPRVARLRHQAGISRGSKPRCSTSCAALARCFHQRSRPMSSRP